MSMRVPFAVVAALALGIAWAGVAGASAPSGASNRARARADVRTVLGHAALPPGAVRLAGPPPGSTATENRFPSVATPDLIDAHAYYRVRDTPSAVLGYVGAHNPHVGTLQRGSSSGPGGQSSSLSLTLAPVAGVLGLRVLLVKVAALGGGVTAVRVDAQDVWVIPRASAERIPAGVGEIDVTRGASGNAPAVSAIVTSRATIARIVALINSLPTVQPYALACPAYPAHAAVATLTFRVSRGGSVLAIATQLAAASEPTTGCDPMSLTLDGRPQTPLLRGAAALHTIGRLLGIRLALSG